MGAESLVRALFVTATVGALSLLSGALLAQNPAVPEDHPEVDVAEHRADAATRTERLRGSGQGRAAAVPIRNLIDEHIFGKMARDGVPHALLSSDEEFFRRIHLDLVGRIPRDDELREFLANEDPGKRDALIDALLETSDSKNKWSYFFGDMFRIARNRVGQDGKNLFRKWFYDGIHLDRPYDEMVMEMLTASAQSNWYSGPASYVARWVVIGACCDEEVHEDSADEVAINAVKHFLGVDMTCVSCHDGAYHLERINHDLSQRKREATLRMSAFFGETRILRRTEVSTARDEYSIDDFGPGYDPTAASVLRVPRLGIGIGEDKLAPAFAFTGERPDQDKPLRYEFARMLTEYRQFPRSTVNLLWSEMFGVGIVDPPLAFDLARLDPENPPPEPWDLQPTHPELLEALTDYFIESNYSLRSVIRLIAQSSAYQLSSQFPEAWQASYAEYFARKFVRRLKAEAIYDSIVNATGLQKDIPIVGTDSVAKFAIQVASPEDFRGRRGEDDVELKDIHFFLEAFGQPNWEFSERSNEGEITQAVLLMNSPFILRQIKAAEGSFLAELLEQDLSIDDKIGRLFERFLVRAPAAEEIDYAKGVIADDGTAGWEDLQWLLINKVEFVHNY